MAPKSRGPVPIQTTLSVPSVPSSVPTIREAVPTGPLIGPQVAPTGPRVPPLRGDGGRDRVGRQARIVVHSCGMHVLAGLDDEPCGLWTLVDPFALSPIGEVAALSLGRSTYYLLRGCLERRDRWTIPGHLPSHELPVLAIHDCTPMRADWLLPPRPRAEHAPTAPTEGVPF